MNSKVKLINTKIHSCKFIKPKRILDNRGYFNRIYCSDEYGCDFNFVQTNLSFTLEKGTIRGLHYQVNPYSEEKIVTCVSGSIFDVVVDLRPDSPTYLQHESFLLNTDNGCSVLIPKGCAHGFQTLEDNSTVHYLVSNFHNINCEKGLKYDDKSLNIDWPLEVTNISDKDSKWPLVNG